MPLAYPLIVANQLLSLLKISHYCSGGGAIGSGPKRDVAAHLVQLAASRDLLLESPSERYRSIRPSPELTSPLRQIRLQVAGLVSFLHILWSEAGPEPFSPFLLFASLTDDITQMVDCSFVRCLDEGEREKEFFSKLEVVEDRRQNNLPVVLEPMREMLAIYKEMQVQFIHYSRYTSVDNIDHPHSWPTQKTPIIALMATL